GTDILGRKLPDLYAGFVRRSVLARAESPDDHYRPVRLAPQLIGADGSAYAFLVLPSRITLLGNLATTLGLLLAAVLVVGTIAWLIARAFARPLGELQRVVREIASGQSGARVPAAIAARRDEIGELATDFNSMADRLARLLESRSQLMAELSHELRSPLARLQAALELAAARNGAALPERERIASEIRRIDAVIGDLMRYSRLDAAAPIARRLVRIDELLRELVGDEEVETRARGVELRLDASEAATVAGDPELLRSAIENVLRNAIRHSPAHSGVDIVARRDGAEVVVAIADRGPGVPDEWLERIFEPYVRAPGQTSAGGGTGLGLAIARRVVQAHGGAIRASLREGGGLEIQMRLPLADVS
ncbi:MAG: HAMP domain-containing histidine kinase, partial [Steroidobacteraceae bacterium]|nr:HAMP domain-containing histidine kinase [Steroidobacteraceae bacterium]MDW8260335.1 HAMP domain-containing sensor histidine kinase [Gammaproteobacteria bacterium]